MKRIICIISILTLLFLMGCEKQISYGYENVVNKNDSVITKSEMIEDITTLKDDMINTHPILRSDAKVEEFENEVSLLIDSLPKKMREGEFFFEIAKVAAMIDEPHTSVTPNTMYDMAYYRDYALNLKTIFTEDTIYVSEDNDYFSKGDEILKIGGYEYDELIDLLDKSISNSNEYWLYFMSPYYLRDTNFYYYINVVDMDGVVTFEVSDVDLNVKQIEVDLDQLRYDSFPEITQPQMTNFDKDNSIAYLNLDTCMPSQDLLQFVRDFYLEAKAGEYKKVVIDLRQNGGGWSFIQKHILMGVDSPNYVYVDGNTYRNRYRADKYVSDGDFYVLTSNNTASAAIILTAIFQYNDFATIVGQPPGDTANIHGVPMLDNILPHTEYSYSIANNKSFFIEYPGYEQVYPDVHIPITRDDVIEGNDPVMEWVIAQ